MNKTVRLAKGTMEVFDLNEVRLHAYKTNDPIADTVFLLEKNGKVVIIEQPCFFDNIKELTQYINSLDVKAEAKILPYHMAGATFLPEVAVYATEKAISHSRTGGGKNLITNFSGVFGNEFDSSIPQTCNVIKEEKAEIGGFVFNIFETSEAFDIEMPEINSIYTHMLGADTHSIIAGAEHADAITDILKGFINKKYNLILSSHHMPETLKDVETKIAYIENIKKIAADSKNASDFKSAAKKNFPDYYGENYLDMTADFFFPAK